MKHILLVLIATLIISTSCKVMYIPNSLNVPLFNEKHEFKANVGFYDYQLAYSLTKNIGLLANGYVRNYNFLGSSGTSDLNYSTSRNLFEGGIGYFKTLGEGFIYETYIGAGKGKVAYNGLENGISSGGTYNYSADFQRFFIQPSIGFSQDIVDVAFSLRVVDLSFNHVKTDYTQQMLVDDNINGLDQVNFIFIEPAITFRIGYKWGKFQTQLVYSNKMNAEPLNYQKFCFNIGLSINIAPRFRNIKKG
jgi:hypothetical protein